jgi:hypothetical protein
MEFLVFNKKLDLGSIDVSRVNTVSRSLVWELKSKQNQLEGGDEIVAG